MNDSESISIEQLIQDIRVKREKIKVLNSDELVTEIGRQGIEELRLMERTLREVTECLRRV